MLRHAVMLVTPLHARIARTLVRKCLHTRTRTVTALHRTLQSSTARYLHSEPCGRCSLAATAAIIGTVSDKAVPTGSRTGMEA